MKTVMTAGVFVLLVMPSIPALATGEGKSSNESEAVRLMEQTRAYVQQQNQYHDYAAADTRQPQTQDQTRSMVGADNETGQGELNRERIQHREGTGDQNKYGRGGEGDGQYSAGGGKGAGSGGGGGRR